MARRTANRLYVEEIDEVSSVDIPANQLGLIAIAKRAGEPQMDEYTDEQGNPVDLDDVEVGTRVFNADGESFVMQDSDTIDEMVAQGILSEDDVIDLDDADPDDQLDDFDPRLDNQLAGAVGKRGGRGATVARGRGAPGISGGQRSETQAGRRRAKLGEPVGKSAGQQILSELRKALTDADRDEIIAKAFDGIAEANERADRAEQIAKSLAGHVQGQEYVELAKSYDGIPTSAEELGAFLHRASTVFSKRDLATLERILETAQDGGAALTELGFSGTSSGSGVYDEVQAMAHEVVGKSGDVTHEQAVVALLEANPDAYDLYETERR